METRKDLTRITTHALTKEDLRARVRELTDAECPDPWKFGLETYNRKNPPPTVLSDP